MNGSLKFISIALVIIVAIILQGVLILADHHDSPGKVPVVQNLINMPNHAIKHKEDHALNYRN